MNAPVRPQRDPVACAVDHTIGAIMNGIVQVRRTGWCPLCERPAELEYLPEAATRPTREYQRRQTQRRRDLDRRLDLILRGHDPGAPR